MAGSFIRTPEIRQKLRVAMMKHNPMNDPKLRKKAGDSKRGKPIPKLQKENHWNWQGGKSFEKSYHHRTGSLEYRIWRGLVFERDNWTCQTCNAKSSVGEVVYLEAHHIKSWSKFEELRYEIKNGVTLCNDCHKLLHKSNKC